MKRIDSVGRYVSTGVRTTGRDARVVTRRPLLAYIVKDLRVASRNPSTGFLFALPIFETLAVIVPLASSHIVKMAVMLVASVVGGSFALFVAFLLASVEQARMDYGDVLPIGSATPTFAKTIVAVVSFLPTPVFLAAVSYGRLTYVAGSLIPFLMTLAVFAGCVGEVTVLRRFSRRSRVSIMTFGSGIGVGTALVLLPVVAYAMTYLSSKNHTVSLLACGLIASAELGLALLLARRSR
jgi:predicted permease